MTRRRKWLLGIGAAIAALIVVLVALLFWVLYTPSGLRFALDRGVAMMHGQLAYANASGTLAGTTTINGLRYRDKGGTTVAIAHASVDLRPWASLGRRLKIAKARIDGIAIDIAPSQQPKKKSTAFSLEPPLAISLDDTLLTHIVVKQNGKQAFAADSLAIAGLWNSQQVVIRQLALRAPSGSAELEGTLAVAAGHAGHGTARFDWSQDGTRYTGSVTSRSDGKTVQLHAQVAAPTRLDANVSLSLDASHAWTLVLDAPEFDARVLPMLPSSVKAFALNLRGAGNANSGKLEGSVVVNDTTLLLDPAQFRYDGKTVSLDPLRLRSPQIAGNAVVTGVVHLDTTPLSFALDAKWSDVQVPADIAGQALATHGEVTLDGGLEHYAMKGALAIGPPDRLVELTVDLAGTPQAIDLHALKLVQRNGGLDASGTIGLQP
ncbi:MAG TPA: hypothetical protein VJQ42_05250 [Rhodanobacteraceae bacterium]|nr:hypothetical protein [Rhodanobacteraceae bacterium]